MLQADEGVGRRDLVSVGVLAVDEECVRFPQLGGEHPIHRELRLAEVRLVEPKTRVEPHLAQVQLHRVRLWGSEEGDRCER